MPRMDTPGHVSERDGQEEDKNKWAAGGGEGIRLPSKRRRTQRRSIGASERESVFLRKFGEPQDVHYIIM